MMQPIEMLSSMLAEGRRILVYGAGSQGRGVVRTLENNGITPTAFVDRNPDAQKRNVAGIPVLAPTVLAEPNASESYFVIVAAFFFEAEISALLESHGFRRGKGYLPYSELKPRDYAVEVSGICNLRCISCPRAGHRTPERSATMMSLDTFKKVLAKIKKEDPFVGNIQLYQWGEPTLNKELPAMIRHGRDNGILCTVSSNLNHAADFAALIESRPECLRISVSGVGKQYGVTHTGGKWDVFAANVKTVAELRRRIYQEMKVELYYHRYKNSVGKAQDEVADLCRKSGFEFHPIPAYLISLDDVLAYCEGQPLPETTQRARELLLVDLDEGLKLAKREMHLDCDALRVILINADLSVSTCMMFYYPEGNTVAANFLEAPLDEIIARRKNAALCVRCRKHGIHRYCGVYAKMGEEERR